MAVKRGKNTEGQAVIEYILMLFVVLSAYMILVKGLTDGGAAQKLLQPIQQDFRRAYQFGHPKARGFEDGAPELHPRVQTGKDNFRLFINPRRK